MLAAEEYKDIEEKIQRGERLTKLSRKSDQYLYIPLQVLRFWPGLQRKGRL